MRSIAIRALANFASSVSHASRCPRCVKRPRLPRLWNGVHLPRILIRRRKASSLALRSLLPSSAVRGFKASAANILLSG